MSGCTQNSKGNLTTDEGRLEAAGKHTQTREGEGIGGGGGEGEGDVCIQAKAVNEVGNRMLEGRRGRQGGVYMLLDRATTGRVLAERSSVSVCFVRSTAY